MKAKLNSKASTKSSYLFYFITFLIAYHAAYLYYKQIEINKNYENIKQTQWQNETPTEETMYNLAKASFKVAIRNGGYSDKWWAWGFHF